jgi:hypothetical protein
MSFILQYLFGWKKPSLVEEADIKSPDTVDSITVLQEINKTEDSSEISDDIESAFVASKSRNQRKRQNDRKHQKR